MNVARISMTETPSESHVVLVVDDDPDVREALSSILEDEGYRVASAGNGREALDWLRAGRAPCIIILDLMMPIMNGWEFLQAIRSEGGHLASLPVCVVSAYADRAPTDIVAVLRKPLEIDALLSVVAARC